MDKTNIRGVDIISGLIFFILGVIILIFALQMPLKDSFGGVSSVWYVSPALLPIIIGIGICILSVAILRHAFKNGGVQQLKEILEKRKQVTLFSENNIRFASILIPLGAVVYINITRIDIFFVIASFLMFTVSVFYINNMQLMKKMLLIYSIEMGFLLIMAVFSLDKILGDIFIYSMDIVALILLIILNSLLVVLTKKYTPEDVKKLRKVFLVSYLTPVFIILFFKFILRIPMPKEGAIVDLFALVYYTLR